MSRKRHADAVSTDLSPTSTAAASTLFFSPSPVQAASKVACAAARMPTHLIVVPYDSGEESVAERQDLMRHAASLSVRLRRRHTRVPQILEIPMDDSDVNLLAYTYSKLTVVYVMGHCNGRSFGSKHLGYVDLSPQEMAAWLERKGLLRKAGVTIKLMGCHTAERQLEFGGQSYVEVVVNILRDKGGAGKDIMVRGYQGSVFESSDGTRTLAKLMLTDDDENIIAHHRVRASEVSVTCRI